MQKVILIIQVFFLCFFLSNCKSSKKGFERPTYTKSNFIMPELNSTVTLKYKLNKASLRDTFNTVIDELLIGEMGMEALGMDIEISKEEPANIEFQGRQVLSSLPLKIKLSKSTFISNIKAEGVLELTFITQVDLDASWNLKTSTSLEQYHWVNEPKVDLGVFTLPISRIANSIIDNSKERLEEQIDLSINEQMAIRDNVLEMMQYVEQPILIDTMLNSWVHVKPETVFMSDMINTEDWAVGSILVKGKSKITSEKPDDIVPGIKLPEFKWVTEVQEKSEINAVLDITFNQINKYLQENYIGETFENGGKKVTVKNVEIFGHKNELIAIANLTGSYNGEIQISGIPKYDKEKQVFYCDEVDIKFGTKNILHKAGTFLMKGKIKKQLRKLLYFSIEDNFETFQNQIDKQIQQYNIDEKLYLKAELDKIVMDEFVIDSDRIHAFTTLKFLLESEVYDMRAFDDASKRFNLKRR